MKEAGSNFGRLAPDLHITIKDRPVSSRVSGSQADQIEIMANESNMTVSTYIRHILQKAIDEQWVYEASSDSKTANSDSKNSLPRRRSR